MKKIYISGPMTGHQDLNKPLFHQTAAILKSHGFDVVNPAELNPDPSAKWEDCMRTDIKALVDCDCILMMPNWEDSRGAGIEYLIAAALGMPDFHSTKDAAEYFHSFVAKPL